MMATAATLEASLPSWIGNDTAYMAKMFPDITCIVENNFWTRLNLHLTAPEPFQGIMVCRGKRHSKMLQEAFVKHFNTQFGGVKRLFFHTDFYYYCVDHAHTLTFRIKQTSNCRGVSGNVLIIPDSIFRLDEFFHEIIVPILLNQNTQLWITSYL